MLLQLCPLIHLHRECTEELRSKVLWRKTRANTCDPNTRVPEPNGSKCAADLCDVPLATHVSASQVVCNKPTTLLIPCLEHTFSSELHALSGTIS